MKSKILILCTGNSCRSQMAEGFLKSIDPELDVYSAGTNPANRVNPYAIKVMMEKGIDISGNTPRNVSDFLNDSFDYVITVCDQAKENCPVFLGNVLHQIHAGYEDPADAKGTEDEVLPIYRNVRDQIFEGFRTFYDKELMKRDV